MHTSCFCEHMFLKCREPLRAVGETEGFSVISSPNHFIINSCISLITLTDKC